MAQSLIKKLEKVDRIEVDKDDNSVMKLSFPISVTPGKVVVEAENISKNYEDLVFYKILVFLLIGIVKLHLSDKMVKVNRHLQRLL